MMIRSDSYSFLLAFNRNAYLFFGGVNVCKNAFDSAQRYILSRSLWVCVCARASVCMSLLFLALCNVILNILLTFFFYFVWRVVFSLVYRHYFKLSFTASKKVFLCIVFYFLVINVVSTYKYHMAQSLYSSYVYQFTVRTVYNVDYILWTAALILFIILFRLL